MLASSAWDDATYSVLFMYSSTEHLALALLVVLFLRFVIHVVSIVYPGELE